MAACVGWRSVRHLRSGYQEVLASVADATVEDALEAVAAAMARRGVGRYATAERAEAAYAAEFLRWFSEEAVRVLGEISTAPAA